MRLLASMSRSTCFCNKAILMKAMRNVKVHLFLTSFCNGACHCSSRGYVAHVDRIPAEIYTLIFEFSVSMDAISAYNFFFDDTTKAPWLLGQVCSRWRTIVPDAPTLCGP